MSVSEGAEGVRLGRRLGGIVALILLAMAVGSSNVYSYFEVLESETFDGTELDLEDWEVRTYSIPEPIHQDHCLIFESAGEYVTTQVTVGVGDIVRVQLLEHPMGNADSSLYLTTKNREVSFSVAWDSHFVFLKYRFDSSHKDYGFVAGQGGDGHSGGRIFGLATHPPLASEPLTLEIERLAENSFVSRAYDSNMALIGEPYTSVMFDMDPEAQFYVSLVAYPRDGGRTVFDNVTILRARAETEAPRSLNLLDEWGGDSTHSFGETPAEAGQEDMIGVTYGQTFRIEEEGWFRLDNISFQVDDYAPGSAPETCQFEVYVMPWAGTRPIPQAVYCSEPLTTTAAWRFEEFTLAPEEVLLAGKTTYVVLFTANRFLNGVRSDAAMASVGNRYPGGGLYIHRGATFDDLFTQDWSAEATWSRDLALNLEWSPWKGGQ